MLDANQKAGVRVMYNKVDVPQGALVRGVHGTIKQLT
jgi:hypothetical protein